MNLDLSCDRPAARGQQIVTLEADLSWGVDIIPRLLSSLRETEAHMVIASPYLPGGRLINVPMWRAAGSRAANMMLSRVLPVTMATGMTRAYRANWIKSLPLISDGKELHVEILEHAVTQRVAIHEIPATLKWPPGRRGTPPSWRSIVAHVGQWTRLRRRPRMA